MNKIPVINCISNIVAANDCANILLAAGFSPMMADEPQEMEEIAAAADATVINLGTPNDRKYEAAAIVGHACNAMNKPVVIDPVGVAVSAYRRKKAAELMGRLHPDVIRCNLNEAVTLLGIVKAEGSIGGDEGELCGIDSREEINVSLNKAPEVAKALAAELKCVVLISGAADVVSDGVNVRIIEGGSDMLKQVTGSGCMLSVLVGGFCTRKERYSSYFEAACSAASHYKKIAEHAAQCVSADGSTGELRMRIIDAAAKMKDFDNPDEFRMII